MRIRPARAQGAEPARPVAKIPRLFSGCCAYTYRHDFLSGSLTLEAFIEKAVELGLDSIDITVYYMKSQDSGYIENLRYLGYKNGVAFSGAARGSSMVQPDAAKRADVLKDIKKWVDVTDRLGAEHLRRQAACRNFADRCHDLGGRHDESSQRLLRQEGHHARPGRSRRRLAKCGCMS